MSNIISFFSLFVAIASFFRDKIFENFKPALKIEAQNRSPDCVKTPFYTPDRVVKIDGYQFRIRIINDSKQEATRVRVTAERLEKMVNGSFVADNNFIPLFLFWTHHRTTEVNIYSETYAFCDFGIIYHPQGRFEIYGTIRRYLQYWN